ncbi:LysR family transcriptional regulator [Rhodobacterales bacterium 52_120_T64]|nr:LysR family transcriptional regulator [Rhodobacterales bacterium 52_120_T64]
MPRNLDMTALRAFVTVAETGGVTRAAGQLHLTQSAVSMQVKRLEESIGQSLLERAGRGVALTAHGEQMLGYGRRILALNDEVWARMTDQAYEGEITLGVPSDIIYPYIPTVLQRFAVEYPRIKVNLLSSYTSRLKRQLARGEVDIILTTETEIDAGGETLQRAQMLWVGSPGGASWKARPARLAFEHGCAFRSCAQRALDEAGILWEMAVESDSTRTVEASVSADLAIHAALEGTVDHRLEVVPHNGVLPDLPLFNINMYVAAGPQVALAERLANLVRHAYGSEMLKAAE